MNTSNIIPTEREELAWAAGFLDGEACFKFYVTGQRGRGRLAITVAQVRREPLDRLAALFGGAVRGPYGPYQQSKQAHFQWDTSSYERAQRAIEAVWPWLSEPKREQASQAMKDYKNRREPKTPFHPLKTECIRGHDLTNSDNVYEFKTSNGTIGRQCRPCRRERKQEKKRETM